MSIVRKIKNRSTLSSSSAARNRRDIARALQSAPTMASREELYLLQNR